MERKEFIRLGFSKAFCNWYNLWVKINPDNQELLLTTVDNFEVMS
jgi:hypothetical protein